MSGPGGITCQELVEIVTDYLDGALSPEDVARLRVHLSFCDPCVEYIEQVRTTARLAAAAEAALDRHPDRDALLETFRAFKQAT